MRTYGLIAILCLGLGGCAVGYAGNTRVVGIAAGNAQLSACSAEQDVCPTINGGVVSEPFTRVLGNLFGAVTDVLGGAYRGVLDGLFPDGPDEELADSTSGDLSVNITIPTGGDSE